MTSIYCDEDVDVLLKPLLEAKGFKVMLSMEENMLGASDVLQLEYAAKKRAVFITHNRVHFEQLYSDFLSEGREHFGIIAASRRNVYELARRIAKLLTLHGSDSFKNRFFYA